MSADPLRIRNPVLPGFHPDPSILRVGDDFYVACSTFEWFPGVRIHHSRDLAHWRLVGHALTRRSQLDLVGDPSSGGVWAPELSHDGQRFHLVYTDVKSHRGGFVDAHNFLVTAERIEGPWSEPIPLGGGGFDPALFHAPDGRKWLLHMVWDQRLDHRSGGIALQEYDPAARSLVGEPRCIFRGTVLGGTEGPHLYQRDGWYHLMTAEGGTGYGHAVTMARARDITGPYEPDPTGPLLTTRDAPGHPLQKAGHASLVELADESAWIAFLCARPLAGTRRCNLGRETALERVEWSADGWLRLAAGGRLPRVELSGPALAPHPFPPAPARDDFDAPALTPDWSTLREPADERWLSLTARPGWLRLVGRESPISCFCQSVVARRLVRQRCEARTLLECRPRSHQHMAGLLCVYDERNFAYLCASADEGEGTTLSVWSQRHGAGARGPRVAVPAGAPLHLRARFDDAALCFSFSLDGAQWRELEPLEDAGRLSDDECDGFTGTLVGLAAHDTSGGGWSADFDCFEWR